MRDNIVYVLGAGFSAPLGIPVISDFYYKPYDMYLSEKERNDEYFRTVRDIIKEVGKVKTYMNFDLRNIEEILSIIEMRSYLENDYESKRVLQEYIKEVIEYYTPDLGEFNFERLKTQIGLHTINHPHHFFTIMRIYLNMLILF